jgi:hypothetical protein
MQPGVGEFQFQFQFNLLSTNKTICFRKQQQKPGVGELYRYR